MTTINKAMWGEYGITSTANRFTSPRVVVEFIGDSSVGCVSVREQEGKPIFRIGTQEPQHIDRVTDTAVAELTDMRGYDFSAAAAYVAAVCAQDRVQEGPTELAVEQDFERIMAAARQRAEARVFDMAQAEAVWDVYRTHNGLVE